jgi:uridine kinase
MVRRSIRQPVQARRLRATERLLDRYAAAIQGPSCAGKTTLAAALAERLLDLGIPAQHVDLDSFYIPRNGSGATLVPGFDNPSAIDWGGITGLLQNYIDGAETLEVPIYDHRSMGRGGCRRFSSPRVLIIEGLWPLTLPEIRRNVDLKIYLSCPDFVCRERRLRRDVERGWSVIAAGEYHSAVVVPQQRILVEPIQDHCDLTLSGLMPVSQNVQLVLGRALSSTTGCRGTGAAG